MNNIREFCAWFHDPARVNLRDLSLEQWRLVPAFRKYRHFPATNALSIQRHLEVSE